MKISVIIATRNRPQNLANCINSLLKNSYTNFEAIIVDQSTSRDTEKVVKAYESLKIRYLHTKTIGKTKAVNLALRQATGDIVSFSDDDNRLSQNWLFRINRFFQDIGRNPKIAGVCGQVIPYQPTHKNGYICPNYFLGKISKLNTDPHLIYYRDIGLGGNLSVKKSVLERIGFFKEWLGPGNFYIAGGEDGEFIYRILKNDFIIAFDPHIVLYHDRWITYHELRMLQSRYTCGEIAFYFYYLLKGDYYLSQLIIRTVRERLWNKNVISRFQNLLQKPSHLAHFRLCAVELGYSVLELYAITVGVTTALLHQND